MSELAVIFYKVVKHNSHCVICKSPDVQFHHVCPEQKIAEVHKVAKSGNMQATIDELNKCITLCQPHHSAAHKGVIPGYLKGHYDNGKRGDDWYAKPHMPMLKHFAQRKKHVLLKFYTDYIEREHRALWPVFNSAGIALPISRRLALVSASHMPDQSGPDNTPDLAA